MRFRNAKRNAFPAGSPPSHLRRAITIAAEDLRQCPDFRAWFLPEGGTTPSRQGAAPVLTMGWILRPQGRPRNGKTPANGTRTPPLPSQPADLRSGRTGRNPRTDGCRIGMNSQVG